MTAITAAPLLAEKVLVVDGTRSHYYKLPQIIVAEVVREQGEKDLIVKTDSYGEFEQLRAGVYCVGFPEDVEKAIALRDVFQNALDQLASGLTEMMRYDKALASSSSAKNPLTPIVVAAEDPEDGKAIDPQTWRSLKTEQEDWVFLPVERVEVSRHMQEQGLLIPKDSNIAPIPFVNAFACDSEEEWQVVEELSKKVEEAQKNFLGHLRSLDTYYDRQQDSLEMDNESVEVEVLTSTDETEEIKNEIEPSNRNPFALSGVANDEREWLDRILIELQVENKEEEADTSKALIDETKEQDCLNILRFLILAGRKKAQAMWLLKFQVLNDGRSSRFGDFENICRRLYEKKIIDFKPNTAREYAFGYEERRQLEAAKVIEPGQDISITALLGIRQFKDDIQEKKNAIEYCIQNGGITRERIDEYRNLKSSSGTQSKSSSPKSASANPKTPASTPPSTPPSTPTSIIGIAPKAEIEEGDLVECLPGAKYIGGREIPVGTKGSVQSVNNPPKQCYFIEQDNPEQMGYVLLDHLNKVVSPQSRNYDRVVEETSQDTRVEKLLDGYKSREAEKDKRIRELENKLQEAEEINKDLMWRFQEMAKDPTDTRAKTIREAALLLQKYEEEYGITEIHPDVKNCVADLWDILRRATFDPVEDKALG